MAISSFDQLKKLGDMNVEKAKERINKVVAQAKDSLKVLETLQKEGIALAKNLVEMPVGKNAKKITGDAVIKGLSKIGLATQDEVRTLENKIEALANELHNTIAKNKHRDKTSGKPGEDAKTV